MWFWLALGSSVLGAVDIILNKYLLKKVSAALLTWAVFALSLPILLCLVIQEGVPSINQLFLIAVFGSSLAYVFSKTIISHTLKQNILSKVFPLTAFSGLFLYIFGLIFLSESLRPIPVLGLFSVIAGSYILNADKAKEDLLMPFKLLFTNKGSVFFFIAILLGSITSVFDKTGVLNSKPSSPIFTLFVEQTIMVVFLTFYLMQRQSKTWIRELKANFWVLLLNSIIFLVVGLLVFTAYIDGPVALVIGIKRLQIFFILLMGQLFFQDKPTKHGWIATGVMIAGVLMIRLG